MRLKFSVFVWFQFCFIPFVTCIGNDSDFTTPERDAIKRFRIIGADTVKNDSFWSSDEYILRILKSTGMNANLANQKILKYLEFRKVHNLDSILSEDMSDMRKWCNFTVNGHDIQDRPILLFPFGNCNLRRIVLAGKQDRLSRYLKYLMESVTAVARKSKTKSGKQVVEAVGIMDLNGFSFREQACLGCLSFYTHIIGIVDANYPRGLKSLYIINTPKAFQNLLNRVLTVADPTTKDAIHVYGLDKGEWKQELLKTIRGDQIPQILGGTQGTRQ